MSEQRRWCVFGAVVGLVLGTLAAGAAMVGGPAAGAAAALAAAAAAGAAGALWSGRAAVMRISSGVDSLLEDASSCHNSADEPAPLGHEGLDDALRRIREVLDEAVSIRRQFARAEQSARAFLSSTGEAGVSVPTALGVGEAGARLPGVLERLRQTAVEIHRDACSLEELNERVASGAGDQSDAVARTASAVEALSEKIDRISMNADEAARACELARDEARQGLEQVHTVIEGMDRLLARIEANGRMTRRLEDRSNEIGSIIDLIRGISGRTDMLALNATIESVRAGEHGRGFAVVAEEIRKLAERTANATREIGTIVEAIQAETQESIRALGEEQAQMKRESERVRETGSSLERISQVAEQSAKLVEGISRSTNDQVVATQDLVRAMQRISEVTHQTLERTKQSRNSLKGLVRSCEPWQKLATAAPEPEASPHREPSRSPSPPSTPHRRREPAGSEALR
jgi:methyl-accepting chemotaxis protein